MYKDHKVAVVIPAFNEELLLPETVEGLPEYIDYVYVVDDGSTDGTKAYLEKYQKKSFELRVITHVTNVGLGQSLIDGYVEALKSDATFTIVMAGDNQMDPNDLPALLDRAIDGPYDYIKGNRLLHSNISAMPRHRFFGNAILTILSKFATGYYSLMDPQCGYTLIRNTALAKIPITEMTRGYGYNADILCMLNIGRFRVTDVEVRPVYDREKSKIKLWKYIPKTSLLLIRLFFRRLWSRYVVLDFHPLIFFHLLWFFSVIFLIIPFSIRLIAHYNETGIWSPTTMLVVIFSSLIALQSFSFAIWMDMDYNRRI